MILNINTITELIYILIQYVHNIKLEQYYNEQFVYPSQIVPYGKYLLWHSKNLLQDINSWCSFLIQMWRVNIWNKGL